MVSKCFGTLLCVGLLLALLACSEAPEPRAERTKVVTVQSTPPPTAAEKLSVEDDLPVVVASGHLGHTGGYDISFKMLLGGGETDGVMTVEFLCTNRHGQTHALYRTVGDVLGDNYSVESKDYFGLDGVMNFRLSILYKMCGNDT